MASILDDLSRISTGLAEFVVEGKDINELLDAATANLVVQKAAALGFHRPGISNAGGPYPVDENGQTDDELLMGRRGPVAGYRRDFIVLSSI